ncbi:MAG: SufD family Fe-S cluster assembly protein [Elusimicrobiota bacterium]
MTEQVEAFTQEQFDTMPWPDAKSEAFRRSDISVFKAEGHSSQAVNARVALDGPYGTLLEAGAARSKFSTLLKPTDGKLQSLHALGPVQTCLITVPRDSQGALPTEATFGYDDTGSGLYRTRSVASVEPGASGVFIERHRGGSTAVQAIHTLEIFVATGASLDVVVINDLDHQFVSLVFEAFHIERGGALRLFHLERGAKLRRINIRGVLAGADACCALTGALIAGAGQNVDTHMDIVHAERRTKSEMLWKTVLDANAKGSFLGMVRIEKQATGSEAFQASHNLMLSAKAQANPDPRLEIWADDVRAKHAATTGYLDDEQLFYLRSRGFEEADARRLLTLGFLQDAIRHLPAAIAAEAQESLRAKVYAG